MWKATTKTVVMAVAMVGLGTGCDLAAILNQIADEIQNPDDPGQPTVPGDEDDPQDPPTFPEEPVEPPIGDCPPPPDDWLFCEIQLDDCLNAAGGIGGVDDAICFEVFDDCIGSIHPEPPFPEPPIEECELRLDECLNGIYEGGPFPADGDVTLPYPGDDLCWVEYEACIGVQPPPPPIEECDLQLQECLDGIYADWPVQDEDPTILPWPGPGPEELCFVQYDECVGWVEPPPPPISPCDELFGLCLATGVEPPLCEEVFDQCLQNGGGGDPEPWPGDPGWEDGSGDPVDPTGQP